MTNFYCQFDNDDLSIQTYDWPISCGLSGLDYIDDFILSNIFIIMNLYVLTANCTQTHILMIEFQQKCLIAY